MPDARYSVGRQFFGIDGLENFDIVWLEKGLLC